MNNNRDSSAIGHELRTLFALILANLDIIESEHGQSEWIDDIREECKRSTSLINGLIEEAQKAQGDTVVDVSFRANRMAHFFTPLIKEKKIVLTHSIEEGVQFSMDESDLVQLFSILVGNACKYCDREGSIFISLRKEGSGFRFSVKNSYADAGSDDPQRFFEPFYRHAEDAEGTLKGYGIGLAIAKKIVEDNHGTIEAIADEEEKTIELIAFLGIREYA